MFKYFKILPILLLFLAGCSQRENYYRIEGFAQGGTYHITCRTTCKPDFIKEKCDQALSAIDNSLSGYNKGSILSKVNANSNLQVDSLFEDLFFRSYRLYKETGGLFDISGAPLFDLWGFGFSAKESVTQEKIDSILQFVGMDKITITNGSVVKQDPRIKVNFNAIAQGYSCDVVARVLEQYGICDYLVEVGMEIVCKGKNPSGKEWKIGIDSPIDGNMEAGANIHDTIELTDAGIVTSGNYRKFYIENGEKFSHTINPLTGYPVKHNLLSATVIASDATLADAYATYCMVMGLDSSITFLESRPDLEGYLIYSERDTMKTYFTNGIENRIRK